MLTRKQSDRILEDMKPLCEMLKDWRELLKLTPAEAARRLDMSAQHYWQLEHGERVYLRPATMQKLSSGTGIPMDRLIVAASLPVPVA